MCRVVSDVIWYMYIRLFIANDVFVVISLPKSFIYCLPIILFYPTYIFHGGYGFSVGAIPCYGFSVGAIPCGCPSSILFWSTVGESFLYGSTVLGIVFILGRPRGSPLRDSFYFGWRLGVAIMGFVSINVVMLTIRFQPFALLRSLSLSHFQYAQIRMPCFGNKWVWNTIPIVHNHILSDEYCGGYVWQGYRSCFGFLIRKPYRSFFLCFA